MKSTTSILAIICTVSIACIIISAAVILAPTDQTQKETTSNVYQIEYVLNGGVNSEYNPDSYIEGNTVDLKDPTRDGYIFTGWYADEELENEIVRITEDASGRITLYAGWERSMVGVVLNYDMDGTSSSRYSFFSNTNIISGTISYTYLGYSSEKGYMMSYDETYTITNNRNVRTYEESDTYWANENDDVSWELQSGTETISTFEGDIVCEIWIGTGQSYSEKQYIGADSGLCYLIEYQKTSRDSTTSMTYTLKSTDIRDVVRSYEIKAYCDVGIDVSGSGTIDAYSTVTLRATASEGTTFSGWYSENGDLLSSSKEYVIDTLLSDVTVYAKNTSDPDNVFNSTEITLSPEKELTGVIWAFTDGEKMNITSDVLAYTFTEPGQYFISYSGTDSEGRTFCGCMDIMVNGYVTRTYSWVYDGTDYCTSLDILYSDFCGYRADSISREQGTEMHDLKFITYEDKYIVELAADLMELGKDLTSAELADFILAFTQYIEYQYDEDSMGVEEYWKYPVETLFDQNGDCEDTSILFCAIAKACGYDCCIILFSGHMAAGVVLDSISGNIFTDSDGTEYGYCETTSSGYSVGDYIIQNGRVVSSYTQNQRGSLFMSLYAVV